MKSAFESPPSSSGERLNRAVALAVALLSAFMGLCDLKADNLARAMQRAQADRNNHWAFYQARNLREEVAKATQAQLRLQMVGRSPHERRAHEEAITAYEALIAQQAEKKDELRREAEAAQRRFDALHERSEPFELADAPSTLALALLAIASLTRRWWLFGLAMVPALWALAMGASGWLGWTAPVHLVARLLGGA
jgi:hypothetical protein